MITRTTVLVSLAAALVVPLVAAAPSEAAVVAPSVHAGRGSTAIAWTTPAHVGDAVSIRNTVEENSASTVFTLKNAGAPRSLDFRLSLPAGARANANPDGSITVLKAGSPIGSFAAPWAKDATGRTLATHYQLLGHTLRQNVDTTGAVFPVTADPKYTTGWVTGTVYFKKSETRTIASSLSQAAGMCTVAAAVLGPQFGAGCGAAAIQLNIQARTALSRGQCVKIKYSMYPPIYLAAYIYSGGYCT